MGQWCRDLILTGLNFDHIMAEQCRGCCLLESEVRFDCAGM